MVVLILVIVLLLAWWALAYYNKAFDEAIVIADSMEFEENVYSFRSNSEVGFIIFSGAKADERSYAYMAKLLYDKGYNVFIPKVLFHMSVTGIRQGLDIIEGNPEVKSWILIGHSLGGVPVSRIASREPEGLEGVAFLASYLLTDLSEIAISAIRINAENDQIMNKERLDAHVDYLPKHSVSSVLMGANHKGFGAYDSVSRDGVATMTWKEQQEETVGQILDFFEAQLSLVNKEALK